MRIAINDSRGCRHQGRYRQLPHTIKPTVIVVDDDASVTRALSTLLQILGHDVLVFDSGADLLRHQIPSEKVCLLIDVYMPGIDGVELCRRLIAAGRYLPIVLMSGSDNQQTRRRMREIKSAARLFKPFDENKLLRAIQKAMYNYSHLPP